MHQGIEDTIGQVANAVNESPYFVSERRDMTRYPEFKEKCWQIGSRPTLATCKKMTEPLKGSGMRWDAENAVAIMPLEALTQSGQL